MRWQMVHPYLPAMGISLWQLRTSLANSRQALIYQCYALCDDQGIKRGGLLVDTSVNVAGYQEKIESLLDAMLQAIHVRRCLLSHVSEYPFGMYLVMGETLAQSILQSCAPIAELRGQVQYVTDQRIPVIATYHPLDLLRQPTNKRNAWLDLQQAAGLWAVMND
jgi:hypothetical protein